MLYKYSSNFVGYVAILYLSVGFYFAKQLAMTNELNNEYNEICKTIGKVHTSPVILNFVGLINKLNNSYNKTIPGNVQIDAKNYLTNLTNLCSSFNIGTIKAPILGIISNINPDAQYHKLFDDIVDKITEIVSNKNMDCNFLKSILVEPRSENFPKFKSKEGFNLESVNVPILILLFNLINNLNMAYMGNNETAKSIVLYYYEVLDTLSASAHTENVSSWKNNVNYVNLLNFFRFVPGDKYINSVKKILNLIEIILDKIKDDEGLIEILNIAKKEKIKGLKEALSFPFIFYLLDLPNIISKIHLECDFNNELMTYVFSFMNKILTKLPNKKLINLLKIDQYYAGKSKALWFLFLDNIGTFSSIFELKSSWSNEIRTKFFELFIQILKKFSDDECAEIFMIKNFTTTLAYRAVDVVEDRNLLFDILNFYIDKVSGKDNSSKQDCVVVSAFISEGLKIKEYEFVKSDLINKSITRTCELLTKICQKLTPAKRLEFAENPKERPLIFTFMNNLEKIYASRPGLTQTVNNVILNFFMDIDQTSIMAIKQPGTQDPFCDVLGRSSAVNYWPSIEAKTESKSDNRLSLRLKNLKENVAQLTLKIKIINSKLNKCRSLLFKK